MSERSLRCGACEARDLLVATIDGRIERGLGVFLATPHVLEFFVDDVADLHEIAEPNAPGLVRGLDDHLLHRHIGARIFFIEPGLLRQLVGGEPRISYETLAVDFFDPKDLPPLSSFRTNEDMIQEVFAHLQNPDRPTAFD